jgi:GMP reductase
MFAGHDESGGEVIERNGEKSVHTRSPSHQRILTHTQYPSLRFKQFYGMSSSTAMKKHSGGVAEYRASEGKVVEVPYRGPVSVTLTQILGGVRSACTYVGASKLKELSKRTTVTLLIEWRYAIV